MVISPTHCAALSTVFFSPGLLDNIVGLVDLVLVYAQNLVPVCTLTWLFAILPSSSQPARLHGGIIRIRICLS